MNINKQARKERIKERKAIVESLTLPCFSAYLQALALNK